MPTPPQPRDTERHGATMVRFVLRAGGLAEAAQRWLARRAGGPAAAWPGAPAAGRVVGAQAGRIRPDG
eukprot:1000592-Prymnesium_polylepis.1